MLAENEKIGISLRGSTFAVTGDLSEEKWKSIEDVLNSMKKSEKNSYGTLFSMRVMSHFLRALCSARCTSVWGSIQ